MVGKSSNRQEPNGRGRPRSRAADQAILQAALKLFIAHGVDGASIAQIAESAGVARTTLYRRWSSKEALLAEAIVLERGDPEQIATADRAASGSLARKLVEALAGVVAAPDYTKLVARLAGSVPDRPELMSTYWNTYIVPRRKAIRTLLEKARARHLRRKDSDPEILLDLIGGAIMYHLLIRPGKRNTREMRVYLRRVLRELGLSDPANP